MRAHLGKELSHGFTRVLPCDHPHLALLRRGLPCRASVTGSAQSGKEVGPGLARVLPRSHPHLAHLWVGSPATAS